MLKSFKLKLYANKGKLEKVDTLLSFWQQEVQRWIDIYWDLEEVKGSYPPKDKRGKSFQKIFGKATFKMAQQVLQ